jgi:chaperone BCS1
MKIDIAAESKSCSSSETDNSTGAFADSEESITSEEETEKKGTDATAVSKEKWVTVKSQESTGTQTTPE